MELDVILKILDNVEKGYRKFANEYKYESTGEFIIQITNGIFSDIRKNILSTIALNESSNKDK